MLLNALNDLDRSIYFHFINCDFCGDVFGYRRSPSENMKNVRVLRDVAKDVGVGSRSYCCPGRNRSSVGNDSLMELSFLDDSSTIRRNQITGISAERVQSFISGRRYKIDIKLILRSRKNRYVILPVHTLKYLEGVFNSFGGGKIKSGVSLQRFKLLDRKIQRRLALRRQRRYQKSVVTFIDAAKCHLPARIRLACNVATEIFLGRMCRDHSIACMPNRLIVFIK